MILFQALTSLFTRQGLRWANIVFTVMKMITGRHFSHRDIHRVLSDSQGNKNAWYDPKYRKKVWPKLRFLRTRCWSNSSTSEAANGCVLQDHWQASNHCWQQKIHKEPNFGSSKSVIYDIGRHGWEAGKKDKSPTITLNSSGKDMEVFVSLGPVHCWTWTLEYKPEITHIIVIVLTSI